MNIHREPETQETRRPRRWRTINQIAESSAGVFTAQAIRALIYRAQQHYNAKGEWVAGNGLAPHISQPGGKGGKVLIDQDGWDEWLEGWRLDRRAA